MEKEEKVLKFKRRQIVTPISGSRKGDKAFIVRIFPDKDWEYDIVFFDDNEIWCYSDDELEAVDTSA